MLKHILPQKKSISSVMVWQARSLMGSYFIIVGSLVGRKLRRNYVILENSVDSTCLVSSVEVWACVVDS